jgi:hypothetical protein
MVSNPPAQTADPHANNPLVKAAGVMRSVAETLAGPPRYTTSIDANTGVATRTKVPLSRSDIALSLALTAISGSLAGLSQSGSAAAGKAGVAGIAQGQQIAAQRRQQQQQQDAQAQADYQRQSAAYSQKAANAHINAMTVAATSESEQRGAQSIDALARINRESGILDVAPELLDNDGIPLTQAETLARMQSGSLSSTDTLGPIAGRTEVVDKDGTKHWESTHLIIRDPNSKMTLTPELYQSYSDRGVPGFPPQTSPIMPTQVPIRVVAQANESLASHYLADQRLADLKQTLQGTPEADKVPTSIDFSKPGVATALSRFRFYVSHNADNLADPYAALKQMGADRRNPQTGEMEPNPDARYVDTIAQTFGGWNLLSAAHDQIAANSKSAEAFAVIDSADKANAVLAAPKRFTADQLSSAKAFNALANQQGANKAAQDARARAVADGSDVEAMYRYGVNPITHEKLTLDNAPDSMLVTSSGVPIPQNQQTLWKPTALEKQTGDTARQVLDIAAGLRKAVQQNPALSGPLSGRSKQGLAKAGLGDAQTQKYLDDLSFLQTAATKMHTGRFSSQILDKMGELIKPGMNPEQFGGALDSINAVAQRYSNEDQLTTVADYKVRQAQTAQANATATAQSAGVPPGATAARDAKGNVVGYRTAAGQYVGLGAK